MADAKNYSGGCHCGQIRYDVTADLSSVMSCNCSLCQKRGALWAFVTEDKFALRAGGEDLTDYQFGKKTIHHLFCPRCGVASFSRGKAPGGQEMIAVNVRCLNEVDIGALTIKPFDGRSL